MSAAAHAAASVELLTSRVQWTRRYPSELKQEGLRSFYHEVERLASAAPQLRSLRVSVRGYASQP